MVQEAISMRGGASHIQDEMREVEEELEEDSSRHDTQNPRGNHIPLEQLEEGKFESQGHSNSHGSPTTARYGRSGSPRPSRGPSINFPLSQGGVGPTRKDKKAWAEGIKEGIRNSLQLMTNPVFAQAFILTFLGEWGDRSQITTIAMGGAHVSLLYSIRRNQADGAEYTRDCIWNDIGSWCLYIRSSNGWSVSIDKDLRQAQYVSCLSDSGTI